MFRVTEDGFITVDASEILSDVQEAYKGALGEDINTDIYTPEGQLIITDVTLLNSAQTQMVQALNSYSIYHSSGKALDVVAQRFGYFRKQSTKTVVNVSFSGSSGLIIPSGFLIGDGENEYETLNSLVLNSSGSGVVQAQCTVGGNIPCYKNTITTIVNPLSGVDSVNNPTNGVVGVNRESDNELRRRILLNWASIRSKTTLGAIQDNLLALNDVVDVFIQENPSDNTITKRGVVMTPHSIYVGILGGESEDIGRVLAVQKTIGATMIGNENIYFRDEFENEYDFKIDRTQGLPVKTKITYSITSTTPADVKEKIEEQIYSYIRENPFKNGEAFSSVLIGNALKYFPFANILSIEVGKISGLYSGFVNLSVSEYAVLDLIEFEVV